MNRQGKLLIAHPNFPSNSPFYKSVIYIYSDNAEGTLGLILNKPTPFPVHELAGLKNIDFPHLRDKVRVGGPVNEKAMIMLHTNDWNSTNTTLVKDGICLSSDNFMLEKLSMGYQPVYWRLMGGVCAWQAGQLDMELNGQGPYKLENAWLMCNATEELMFEHDKERQWELAVKHSSKQMFDYYF